MKEKKNWLVYAIITTVFWGVWGAFIEIPEKSGFPATLGYVVWSITMIPPAIFALYRIKWKPENNLRSIFYGIAAGILGCGGQLILFQALRNGPAYIVFPIISLYPVITIFLSLILLKERANIKQWSGIILSLFAMFFLSNPQINPVKSDGGIGWLILTLLVFVMWGVQAYVLKFSNETMKAESIFFYMDHSILHLHSNCHFYDRFFSPNQLGLSGTMVSCNDSDSECIWSTYSCLCTSLW